MPLIIKGGKEPKVVSKKEMQNLLKSIENNTTEAVLASLSPEVAEKRRETLVNKAARENAARIADAQAESAAKNLEAEKEQIQIAVEEKVKDAVVETVTPITVEKTETSLIIDTKNNKKVETNPDFETMTKKEIDIWADENLGVQLDRRNTKATMIEELKKHL
jgi:ligand-binding sensor domain-containing protein